MTEPDTVYDQWGGTEETASSLRIINAELLAALEALLYEYMRMLVEYGCHVRGNTGVQSQAVAAIMRAKGEPV